MRETDVTAGRSARGESNDPGRAATRGAANGGSKVVCSQRSASAGRPIRFTPNPPLVDFNRTKTL